MKRHSVSILALTVRLCGIVAAVVLVSSLLWRGLADETPVKETVPKQTLPAAPAATTQPTTEPTTEPTEAPPMESATEASTEPETEDTAAAESA